MKYQGIIFDLDGVLCSTDRFHFQAWQQTAREAKAPSTRPSTNACGGQPHGEPGDHPGGQPLTFTPEEKERMAEEKTSATAGCSGR